MELDYLWWLASEPQYLHAFGRKSVNDPNNDLNFTRDKLTMHWKNTRAREQPRDVTSNK